MIHNEKAQRFTHTPVVVDIDDSSQGFPDTVVYDSIHANSDRILAENLTCQHIQAHHNMQCATCNSDKAAAGIWGDKCLSNTQFQSFVHSWNSNKFIITNAPLFHTIRSCKY